jgi:hypothetical protein
MSRDVGVGLISVGWMGKLHTRAASAATGARVTVSQRG